MHAHPYRSLPDATESPATDGFEERAVSVVLMLAGALGLAIGVAAPSANAIELVLGLALLAIGGRTYIRSKREPVL
ncbi:MAG: hypothetical protein U0270_12160 [Labilithrix sp.]